MYRYELIKTLIAEAKEEGNLRLAEALEVALLYAKTGYLPEE